ncbi:sulfate transporter [Oceaniovalibus guishaninsula JLT2003]|uniref:Sulfate transporter n=1 Tax=Oceaniovalibus guishaninsula JLT2003 TaxID=1231392 RepID=K2HSR4_9RHOB|nr:SulP family inorganic anion transporter [Oceaniovalibus guishaninsula]EKE45654.1 sulfate transporter [Oceaniovalibus guishaninsula JLT2003]
MSGGVRASLAQRAGRFRLLSDWRGRVTPATLRSDALAGLTGATIVLPQGVAFAAIAGLPPEYGFYTAMIPPVVAALVGSSWHAVSGPTTAISALVFGTLSGILDPSDPEYIRAAIALALLVGAIQLAFGLARLGALMDFVSHSVMTGFIAGAALLIALSQLRYLLGVDLPRPNDLHDFLAALPAAAAQADPQTLAIGAVVLLVGGGIRWWRPGWPNYLIALAAGTLLALGGHRFGMTVPTIGPVSSGAPSFQVPEFGFSFVQDYGSAAFAIALVGLLEAVSVARAIGMRSGQPIDGNREILGQGASNIAGSLFQCYPASASFTRSGVNFEAGAKSPLAAVFAAVFLFAILQLVSDWFAWVPDAAMGGVILLVAWRLVDFGELRRIAATSRTETAIASATFLSTLLIDLEFAVYVGVFLSFLFFIRNSSRPVVAIGAPDPDSPTRMFKDAVELGLPECPQLVVVRLDGPLFFGSVGMVRDAFRRIERDRSGQKHMLLILKGIGEIDLAGGDLLIEESARRRGRGGSFHLMTRTPRTIVKLARMKVMRALNRRFIHLGKGEAIAEMVPNLGPDICASCTARIFRECAAMPGPDSATGTRPPRDAGKAEA